MGTLSAADKPMILYSPSLGSRLLLSVEMLLLMQPIMFDSLHDGVLGKIEGGLVRTTTPVMSIAAISVLNAPQWSRRMRQERTMVKTGDDKEMAVLSPRGGSETAMKMPRRRNPPSNPWAKILHLVVKSLGPKM